MPRQTRGEHGRVIGSVSERIPAAEHPAAETVGTRKHPERVQRRETETLQKLDLIGARQRIEQEHRRIGVHRCRAGLLESIDQRSFGGRGVGRGQGRQAGGVDEGDRAERVRGHESVHIRHCGVRHVQGGGGAQRQRHRAAGAVGEHHVGARWGSVFVDGDHGRGLEGSGFGDRRPDQRIDQGGLAGLEAADDHDPRRRPQDRPDAIGMPDQVAAEGSKLMQRRVDAQVHRIRRPCPG